MVAIADPHFANTVANLINPTDQFEKTVRGRLPIYRELLGDTDQTQQDIRSKLAFDIAQAGLNLASGTDPRTGESSSRES